ncbi:MAG: acyl-CoA dehydrogenase family protein, partial [Nocardioides sp.]
MDFTFTPEQDEAAELAARILKDRATNERMKQVEADGDRFDPELWAELGSAGLLGLALPEKHDGAGLGLIELCRVLVEVGRTVAPVPLVTHGAAGRLIAEQGSADQKQHWLPGAASGVRLLTAAVAEDRESLPLHPQTTAEPSDDGWALNGVKTLVPTGTRADLFLVTATTPSGSDVFLVEPGTAGVAVLPQRTSDGDLAARLEL